MLQSEGGNKPRAADVLRIDPPTPDRVKTWVDQNIHVAGRPEWVFVKVYTHGAPEDQAESLLGAGGHALHRELTTMLDAGVRSPVPSPMRIETELDARLTTARSRDPSEFQSPVAMAPGSAPTS